MDVHEDETLFLSSLPVIDGVVAQVCRRHRLTAAEADDFAADVRLHFIERNYEPLRRFEGRSSLRTYLTVVIQRLFLDRRNRLWGKWRPSADARRLGPIAMLFERLVTRDGWTVEQAAEALRTHHGVEVGGALAALCVKMAERQPSREVVGEQEAEAIASAAPPPDANVVRAEQGFLAKRVQAALERARQTLSPDERLILKMRFEQSVPIADIARTLQLDQKRLYRTVEQILAKLRRRLEAEGISREEIVGLFADGVLSAVDQIGADGGRGGQAAASAAGARTA